jgi:hypothetical protein
MNNTMMLEKIFITRWIPILAMSWLPQGALAAGPPVAWWSFDATEGRQDAIIGHHGLVPGVRGLALRSNEFETAIECDAASLPAWKNGGFTVEAWIAPRAFPWNYCPIIQQRNGTHGFYFGINYQGQLQLEASIGGTWIRCESPTALPGLDENLRFASENSNSKKKIADFGDARETPSVPLLKWTHVAGSVDGDGTLRLFINGEPAGETKATGAFTPAAVKLVLARTTEPVLPLFLARPPANKANFCSLDGLLDEVKLYDRALTAAEVRAQFQSIELTNPQPLEPRRMPTAQDLPGAFGAFYTRFRYDEDWDRTRRFSEEQDVFVRFDNNPCTFVAWNGTVYPVFYPEGGDFGQMFEAFETWRHPDGCFEVMMDRQSKYSSWRIIENTPARVVLHWRHTLVSYNNNLIHHDPDTGWADCVDDYYTIYPDTVCARRTVLWSSMPAENHSYAQDNSVIQPGFMPWDVYEKQPMSVANLAGQEIIQTMGQGRNPPKDPTFKEPAVIQRHNFKSRWKPFMIAPPKEVFSGVWTNKAQWPWFLPCWHHWPTAQLIDSDGSITFVENGRPKSSCLTMGWGYGKAKGDAIILTPNSLTRFTLTGMTDGSTASLVPLARSYHHPPTVSIRSDGFQSEGFSVAEKAFILNRAAGSATAELDISIAASADSPLVNPAFVVGNWGGGDVAVSLDGKSTPIGDTCRVGFRETPTGRDLILWMKMTAESPAQITLRSSTK